MSKELEEAIRNMRKFAHSQDTSVVTAKEMQTVLNYIDNSIPKEVVEKVFNTKIYNTNYLAKTDWTDYQREVDLRVANLLKVIKQELLEGK